MHAVVNQLHFAADIDRVGMRENVFSLLAGPPDRRVGPVLLTG
jgi:hypothetical protein